MSSYEFIKTERQESTLIARLNNPPRHLLNAKMVLELGALAREVEEDGSVRSLILTGDAEGTFITHYDVGDLSAASDATREQKPPAGDSEVELHGMHKLVAVLTGDAQLATLQVMPRPFESTGGKCCYLIGRGPSRKNPRMCTGCFEHAPQGGIEAEVGVEEVAG